MIDAFNASLLNKSIRFFQKLFDIKHLNGSVDKNTFFSA